MKKSNHINRLLINAKTKVANLALFLLVIAITAPIVSNAKETPAIKVLTLEKAPIQQNKDISACTGWSLTKADVETFFKTAEPFVYSAQINSFDIYNCEVKGRLIINGVEREYSINLGGTAFIYGFGIEQQGYGCDKGECLQYVDYMPYPEN